MRHPIDFHAEMMDNIMQYHQSMNQCDVDQFVKAIVKEVNGHIENEHWNLVKRSDVPKDQDVIPSVWSIQRNHNITTNDITKYKASLNVNCGKAIFWYQLL